MFHHILGIDKEFCKRFMLDSNEIHWIFFWDFSQILWIFLKILQILFRDCWKISVFSRFLNIWIDLGSTYSWGNIGEGKKGEQSSLLRWFTLLCRNARRGCTYVAKAATYLLPHWNLSCRLWKSVTSHENNVSLEETARLTFISTWSSLMSSTWAAKIAGGIFKYLLVKPKSINH